MAQLLEQSDPRSPAAHLTGRNGLIDVLRFFAAIGIVVFHAKAPGAAIGYAALPLFTIYLVHFASSSIRRGLYFLRLWIGWSLLYGFLKVAEIVFLDRSWSQEFLPSMLLTGPSIHLWFLPFAAVVVLLVDSVRRIFTVPVAVATSLISLYAISQYDVPTPFAQWLFVLPSLAFGLVLSRSLTVPAAAAFVVVSAWVFGWTSGLMQFAIAISLATVTMTLNLPATRLTGWMRSVSLGIYLVHPMLIAIFLRLGITEPSILAVLSISASIIFVIVLKPRLPAFF